LTLRVLPSDREEWILLDRPFVSEGDHPAQRLGLAGSCARAAESLDQNSAGGDEGRRSCDVLAVDDE
jgi:hypothetical protein